MKRRRIDSEDEAPRQVYSRLSEEVIRYFAEIDAHFILLDRDEEKALLANNVLGETEGQETQVVPDAACSRILEKLLPWASPHSLAAFIHRCIQGENLGVICTRWAMVRVDSIIQPDFWGGDRGLCCAMTSFCFPCSSFVAFLWCVVECIGAVLSLYVPVQGYSPF